MAALKEVLALGAARIRRSCRALMGDSRGVAAVEFALVAPLMFAMYFVTVELALGIDSNKRVGRIGSMVADLVTQQQTMSISELEAIMRIGESLIQPYNRTKPTITITAIEVTTDATPKVQVVWSRRMANEAFTTPHAKGTATTLPAAIRTPGTFVIRVESELAYKPIITWAASQKDALGLASAFDGISMHEIYYLRPRMSSDIPCTSC
ncbi:TadE/TadG family type IV pilus assembly protein [Pseudaminobacter soli (ex Zhang et al. 2022)]|nr:TadE/TadG family type IV pilus assembly protein [Pseudaminobacter soli]